jgi:hypothetical protein
MVVVAFAVEGIDRYGHFLVVHETAWQLRSLPPGRESRDRDVDRILSIAEDPEVDGFTYLKVLEALIKLPRHGFAPSVDSPSS